MTIISFVGFRQGRRIRRKESSHTKLASATLTWSKLTKGTNIFVKSSHSCRKMISAVAWVPKGVAASEPVRYEMTPEEEQALREAAAAEAQSGSSTNNVNEDPQIPQTLITQGLTIILATLLMGYQPI